MKKVLVTGASGFVGTALLKELEKHGIPMIAMLHRPHPQTEDWKKIKNLQTVLCDMDHINQLPRLISDCGMDTCIHLAWRGVSGSARADYELQLANVKNTLDLIDALAAMGIKRFIGAGTLAEKDVLNYLEEDGDALKDVSNYGTAKITAHIMSKVQCAKAGLEHVWCYLANIYGPGDTTHNFINSVCQKFLNGEKTAFTSGEQLYDFIYITDAVCGICAAAEKGKKNTGYYIGSMKPRQLKDYITAIRDMINPQIELHLGELPFYGKTLSEDDYDCSKIVKDTGYRPLITFEEGMRRTLKWLKEEGK